MATELKKEPRLSRGKKCIYCGKELPKEASWCPFCEKEQQGAKKIKTPARLRRWIMLCAALLVLCGIGAFALHLYHRPRIYEGGVSAAYTIGGKEFNVYLSFQEKAYALGEPMEELSIKLPNGRNGAAQSQLFAGTADHPEVQEEFAAQIASCTVTAQPQDSAQPVEVYEPIPKEKSGLAAAWKSDIAYFPETGTNRICWEIVMKNGDTIRLFQTITCELQPSVTYHYEDTPMNSIEEVQALIDKTAAEDPDTVLNLYLPPVTYEGGLVMDKMTAILYGSAEGDAQTTFTDTMRINTRKPDIAAFYEIVFQGEGGTGIISTDALQIGGCVFTGWDIGIDAAQGSWVSVNSSAFVGNKVGFRINSEKSTDSNPVYEKVALAENEIGLQVIKVPGDTPLTFTETILDNNQTDAEDPAGLVTIS